MLNPSQKFHNISSKELTIILTLLALSAGILGSLFAPQEYKSLVTILPIAALLGLFVLLKPEIVLVLTIVIIPIENSDWLNVPFPDSLSASKLLGIFLIVAFIFNIVFGKMKFRLFDDNHDYVVFGFCAALFFSGVIANDAGFVFSEIDRVLRLVVFYLVIKNLVRTESMMMIILVGFFIPSIYSSLYSINEAMTVTSEWGNSVRASGINENPNNYAMASVIAFAIGFHLLFVVKKPWQRILIFIGIVIVIVGLALSGSRGGMLSFGAVVFLIIMSHPRRLELFFVVGAAVVLSFPLLPQSVQSRLFPSLESSDFVNSYEEAALNSSERRLGYYDFGLQLIVERPILGMGYRSFRTLYPESEFARFDNPIAQDQRSRVAHNVYLETVTGTGLLGLSMLLGILFVTWRGARIAGNLAREKSVAWATARSMEYAVIAYSVSSLFISSEQEKYLWLIVGLSSAVLHYVTVIAKDKYDESNDYQLAS